MVPQTKLSKPRKSRTHVLFKPRGVIHPRVQAVGPQHFAILCIDCAKIRSKIMLADFYGRLLLQPTTVEHDQPGFEAALQQVRDSAKRHAIKDMIGVVERTGRYHRSIQVAFAKAGIEVRVLHPFTTKQYRQPADPGNKTDDTDLFAMHRAAVNGFGMLEHQPDPIYVQLQLLARHRRDLVQKNVVLRQQMLEHLHSYMPGYSRCFADVFDSEILLWIAKNLGSAAQVVAAGIDGLTKQLRDAHIAPHKPTLQKAVAWARSAPPVEESASLHHRLFIELDVDRLSQAGIDPSDRGRIGWPFEQNSLRSASGHSWNQRCLGGRIRGRDGTDRTLRQRPSHYQESRLVPVAVPERRGGSTRRPIGAARQPRACGGQFSSSAKT